MSRASGLMRSRNSRFATSMVGSLVRCRILTEGPGSVATRRRCTSGGSPRTSAVNTLPFYIDGPGTLPGPTDLEPKADPLPSDRSDIQPYSISTTIFPM